MNQRVLEQNRRFYLTVSAGLGIDLSTGKPGLDLDYLKDMFEAMGEPPLPDMGLPKPNGEFLVSGRFYAPAGRAVTGGEVRVRVGRTEKQIYVFGPRVWTAGLPSAPEPITSLPLTYAGAFGGKDYPANPDGMGFNDGRLPCIEDPRTLVTSPKDTPAPAGFGPLSPILPRRMQYQGTYDADYRRKFFPGYPDDHDWRFFLCAPQDQWISGFFTGAESFALHNLHPEHPLIEGRLPGLSARCFLLLENEAGETFSELPLHLDTLWFFPEKRLVLTLFRGVTEVADDEAAAVTHLLGAYESQADPPRPPDHYARALKKRRQSQDDLLNHLNTRDLIPPGHDPAMKLLMAGALDRAEPAAWAGNLNTRAERMKTTAEEKIKQAAADMNNHPASADIPDEARACLPMKDTGPDLEQLAKIQSDPAADPDMMDFQGRLEAILPGLTSADPRKLDLSEFSFDQIDRIFEAVDDLAARKTAEAEQGIQREKDRLSDQIKDIGRQTEALRRDGKTRDLDRIQILEASGRQLQDSLKAIDGVKPDSGSPARAPLPRISRPFLHTLAEPVQPRIAEALQHLEGMKAAGLDDEKTRHLEQQIREMIQAPLSRMDEHFAEAEKNFRESYIMAAHFMDEGLSPHARPLEEVRDRLLEALSVEKTAAGRDLACIDLKGRNLDGVDFSGAFLEQVDFSGASLKGANLSGAILARANLEKADLTGADLKGANMGAIRGRGACFTRACLKSARLSRSDFTDAEFTDADLEGVESLEVILDRTDFTRARMSGMILVERSVSGARFSGADMTGCAFVTSVFTDCDFTESLLSRSAFVDTGFEHCRFEKADLTGACFVATGEARPVMRCLTFRQAVLRQANFQGMNLDQTDFSLANLENAYFGEATLRKADLRHALACNAQFRKADLTGARMDHMNLDQGSLAKANLAGASLTGANLHAVDFLRANLYRTDFTGANLDTTLIEHWRPE